MKAALPNFLFVILLSSSACTTTDVLVPAEAPCTNYLRIYPGPENIDPGNYRKEDSVFQVPYRCNELIVMNPTKAQLAELQAAGFSPVKSCPCNKKLILLRSQGVDPIGIVENPPGSTKDSSLTLNFVMPTQPVRPLETDSIDYPGNPPVNPPAGAAPTVKIAIIDSGTHPASTFLQQYLWVNPQPRGNGCPGLPTAQHGLNFTNLAQPEPVDSIGHGTHVGGIAAGINPFIPNIPPIHTELINARMTYGKTDSMDLFTGTCAMYYALKQGAKVLNLSWGYLEQPRQVNGVQKAVGAPWIMQDVLLNAHNQGAIIVAATGNNGLLLNPGLRFWPANFSDEWDHVIAVGAYDNISALPTKAGFSNWFPGVIQAPGVRILSTVPDKIWKKDAFGNFVPVATQQLAIGTGTSMAAPFISRTVALMLGKHAPAAIGDIKTHIKSKATPIDRYHNVDPGGTISSW